MHRIFRGGGEGISFATPCVTRKTLRASSRSFSFSSVIAPSMLRTWILTIHHHQDKNLPSRWAELCLAVGKGFEPSKRLPAYTLSKRAPSTTRPPHQFQDFNQKSGASLPRLVAYGDGLFFSSLRILLPLPARDQLRRLSSACAGSGCRFSRGHRQTSYSPDSAGNDDVCDAYYG